MDEKLRVGLIGTGWYADLLLLPVLTSQPRASVTAICGRNAENAHKMAQKYGIPHVFTDYRALIDSRTIDALVVAAPDDQHHAITMAALEAGLHVLCEKPLAMNAAQAREVYEKAEVVGVKHMVMFTYQWSPHFHLVRDLVDQSYVGRCFQANFHYLADFDYAWQSGWRFDSQRARGALGDLGSHMIQLARWCLGEIVSVSAQLSVSLPHNPAERQPKDAANDTTLLTVEFASGAHGLFHISAVSHMGERGQLQQIMLYGDQGTLEATATWETATVQGVRAGEAAFTTFPIPADPWNMTGPAQPEPLVNQTLGCRLFIDAILDDKEISPTFYDGYKVQQVIDAALESDRTGCRVMIP